MVVSCQYIGPICVEIHTGDARFAALRLMILAKPGYEGNLLVAIDPFVTAFYWVSSGVVDCS